MDDTCITVRPLLSGILDGELDEPTRHRLEAHLASCTACAGALEILRAQDRLLRRAAEREGSDAVREERALATTLARLREEPRAAWEREPAAAAAARAGRPPRMRWPSWTLRARWITGLAAATAAVLLALRLGPLPLAPERPPSNSRARFPDQTVATEESRSIPPAPAGEPKLGADDRAKKPAEAPAAAKNTAPSATTSKLTAPPPTPVPDFAATDETSGAREAKVGASAEKVGPPAGGKAGLLEQEGTQQEKQEAPTTSGSGIPAAPKSDKEAGASDARASDAQANDTRADDTRAKRAPSETTGPPPGRRDQDVRLAPERPARDEKDARTREGTKRQDSSPSQPLRSTADRLRAPGGLDPMTSFRGQTDFAAPTQEPSFPAVADTADAGIEDWPDLLRAATRTLERDARTGLSKAEAAERWRTLGDLWEWFGRTENDPSACARAVDAYERAREIAGPDAGIDPVRFERARRAAAVTSPGRE